MVTKQFYFTSFGFFTVFGEKKRVYTKPVLNPYSTHYKPVLTHYFMVKTPGFGQNPGFSKPVLNPY